MKKNKSQKSVILMAVKVIETTTDNPDFLTMCDRVQAAIDHEGSVIYNGDDEQVEVPFLTLMTLLYPSFVRDSKEYEDEFYGWLNADSIIVIYFDRLAADKREATLRQYLDASTVDCWLENRRHFDDETCMAVRINDVSGCWYEHIINRSSI